MRIVLWCNGSTTGFGSVCPGSNPGRTTKKSAFEADFFIDTTGDGELIAMTNCDCQLGRESDSLCQPMTTCFRMCGVDIPKFTEDKDMLLEKYNQYQNLKQLLANDNLEFHNEAFHQVYDVVRKQQFRGPLKLKNMP